MKFLLGQQRLFNNNFFCISCIITYPRNNYVQNKIKWNLYTYQILVVLLAWLFEAVRTNPGFGMATLIYNNLLN